MNGERGQTLIESLVCLGIIALLAGAVSAATIVGAHRFGADPRVAALQAAADRELRAAMDVAKYDDARLVANAVATALPLPGASPLPATLALQVTPLSGGALTIVVDARTLDGTLDASATATLVGRAPLPGTSIVAPQTVAQPTGAP